MKTFVAFAALMAALAVPALAQAAPQSNGVVVGSQNLGADPDANVRFDLQREAGSRNGGF